MTTPWNRVTLRQLELFWATVRGGSFAAAAATHFVSPSAVAAAVTQLEQVIGGPLLVRRPAHGVTVTPLGRRVARRVEAVLVEAFELQYVAEDETSLRGPLDVGVHGAAASATVPLLVGFQERHPEVALRIVDGPRDEVGVLLRRGELDLAIGYRDEDARDLAHCELFSQRPFVAVAADDPIGDRDAVTVADLVSRPLIVHEDSPLIPWLEGALRDVGAVRGVRHRSAQREVVLALASAGHGCAVLLGDADLDRPTLRSVGLVDARHEPVVASWLGDLALSPRASLLVAEVAAGVA